VGEAEEGSRVTGGHGLPSGLRLDVDGRC
jgi:hypothetical protein